MKKQLLILGVFAALMTGCQQPEKAEKKAVISLNSAELKDIKNNFEEIRLSLVRKSVLKEMEGIKYSKEEKEYLENLKKETDIEFFLNKKAMEKVKVEDEKVLEIYHQNIDSLKEFNINEALIQIKNELTKQQVYLEKIEYVNSLMEKYNIEETAKKYFAENNVEVKTEAEQSTK